MGQILEKTIFSRAVYVSVQNDITYEAQCIERLKAVCCIIIFLLSVKVDMTAHIV